MPSKALPFRTRLRELPWKIVAEIVSRPWIVSKLIARGINRPYSHISKDDGKTIYMYRYWIFNPYAGKLTRFETLLRKVFKNLMSVRLHHIMVEDLDEHPHDHPWDARTIILRNFYVEERLVEDGDKSRYDTEYRRAGDSFPIVHNQFHKIAMVPEGGTWTLFITFKFLGMWGFLVDGRKVDFRKYLYGT